MELKDNVAPLTGAMDQNPGGVVVGENLEDLELDEDDAQKALEDELAAQQQTDDAEVED